MQTWLADRADLLSRERQEVNYVSGVLLYTFLEAYIYLMISPGPLTLAILAGIVGAIFVF